jgi:hypothetical protein
LTSFTILGALIVAAIIYFAGMLGYGALKNRTKSFHFALYQNETWEQVSNRSGVVRPLVGHNDSFNILATVWLRGDANEQEAYRESRKLTSVNIQGEDEQGDLHVFVTNVGKSSITQNIGERPTREEDDVFEHVLFSEFIFKDANLKDKDLRADIPLSIPTSVLYVHSFILPLCF